MSILTLVFLGSLFGYLKVNFGLLPSDGVGLVLNLLLIVLLAANLVFLGKFWLEWNFITTILNLSGLGNKYFILSCIDSTCGKLCSFVS
jgi:hypothetical protein